jgi:SpoVK/Ycf46/Vps4 family AAA+-type ATPase
MIFPTGEISRLTDNDRKCISICRNWLSEPGFTNSFDRVVFMAESREQLNDKLSCLPQLVEVEVPFPDYNARLAAINWFCSKRKEEEKPKLWSGATYEVLASYTAGLTIQVIMQLLKDFSPNSNKKNELERILEPKHVIKRVEEFIKSQLGESVEFKKPEHTLKDVVGFSKLKRFLRDEIVAPLKKTGKFDYSGAVVAGPNRVGKSFIFEALAAELGVIILVLQGMRSKWFGDTDVRVNRLKRLLSVLDLALIWMDEAHTQLGGIGPDVHETEVRLTGAIMNMMSDPRFRGKIFWLLADARVQLLPPDVRQPGRPGDLMIAVTDPKGKDFDDFVAWTINPVMKESSALFFETMKKTLEGYSAGAFDFVRRQLKGKAAKLEKSDLTEAEITGVIDNLIIPEFKLVREIQTLHALVNCTRVDLLPMEFTSRQELDKQREKWRQKLVEYGEVTEV